MIDAKLVPNKIEIYLNGKGIVSVDCAFTIGNRKMTNNNNIKVDVDLTDKLLQTISEEIYPQIIEKFKEVTENEQL
jgi:hypothetical protein